MSFHKIMIIIQVFVLIFHPMTITASGDLSKNSNNNDINSLSEIRLLAHPNTTNPNGQDKPPVLEVVTYSANPENLSQIIDLIKSESQPQLLEEGSKERTSNADELSIKESPPIIVVKLKPSSQEQHPLEEPTHQALKTMSSSTYPKRSFIFKEVLFDFKEKTKNWITDYNAKLTIVRFLTGTTVLTTSIIHQYGSPLENALLVGLLAGAITGAIQYKTEAFSKIITNSIYLASMAKKLNLLSHKENLQLEKIDAQLNKAPLHKTEARLNEIESFGKVALLEVTFLSVIQLAMFFTHIPITENLFTTAAKSIASQGFYNKEVFKKANDLETLKPHLSGQISKAKKTLSFLGSILSFLGVAGSMTGVPASYVSFALLLGTGAILYSVGPPFMERRSADIEAFLVKWFPLPSNNKCHMLFH